MFVCKCVSIIIILFFLVKKRCVYLINKTKILIHLPIYTFNEISLLRKTTNKLLNQNLYVGIPIIPQWKKIGEETNEVPKAVVMTAINYNIQNNHLNNKFIGGPFLITIMENGKSGICDLKNGNWYFLGSTYKIVQGAIILLVDFSIEKDQCLFGGIIHIIDVLVYDDLNLSQFDWIDKYEIIKSIPLAIKFPERYNLQYAQIPTEIKHNGNFNIYALF